MSVISAFPSLSPAPASPKTPGIVACIDRSDRNAWIYPHALALVARARGLLWGEADAVKFMERIVKKEKVLLELMKHKFPELHKRLRVTIVPTEAQAGSASTAASEVLPRLPEGGVPMELNAGVAFQGGAEEARPAPAPRARPGGPGRG